MSGELRGGSTSFDAAESRRRRRWRHAIWIAALVTILGGWALAGTAQAAVTVTLSLSGNTVVADGTASVTATAALTTDGTDALGDQTVTFANTTSTVPVNFNPTTCTTPVDGSTCSVTITGTTPGTATITASAASATSTPQTLTLTAGPAATITVVLNPTSIAANGTATATATATVKDAQGRLLATEASVVFTSSAGNTVSATTNAGSGDYTATITSTTTVGTATITATDGTITGTATLTQTAGPVSAVTVTLSPTVILANATDTTTATVTVADAQGHPLATEAALKFSSTDPGQFFGQVVNNGNGTYSVQIRSSTRVGQATITATDGTVSAHAVLNQAAGPSITSLVAVPATLVTNQAVNLFAAVSTASGSPSGTITFQSGGTPITGCIGVPITPSNPGATCQLLFTAATSPRHLTAVFTPDTLSTAVGSVGALDVPVAPDSTSVALTGPATATVGQYVTYSATVSPPFARPGPALPSGTVQFLDDGQPIPFCTAQPLVAGSAYCATAYASSGTHNITARYAGDQNFAAATSAAIAVSVTVPPVPPAPVLGTVTALTQWSFYYTPSYTKVLKLIVKRVSIKATVTVKCRGRGCPYAVRKIKVPQVKRCGPHGKTICQTADVNIGRTFGNRHLSIGTVITVIVSRPHWVAKYYTYTVRAGRGPATLKSCLAPDGTKPGVGCSP